VAHIYICEWWHIPQGLGSPGVTRGSGGRRRSRRGISRVAHICMDVRNGGAYIYGCEGIYIHIHRDVRKGGIYIYMDVRKCGTLIDGCDEWWHTYKYIWM